MKKIDHLGARMIHFQDNDNHEIERLQNKHYYFTRNKELVLTNDSIVRLLHSIDEKCVSYVIDNPDYTFKIVPYTPWLDHLICELTRSEQHISKFEHFGGVYVIKAMLSNIPQIQLLSSYSDGMWHTTYTLCQYNGIKQSYYAGIILSKKTILELLTSIKISCPDHTITWEEVPDTFLAMPNQPWLNMLFRAVGVKIHKFDEKVDEKDVKFKVSTGIIIRYEDPINSDYVLAKGKTFINMPTGAVAIQIIPCGSKITFVCDNYDNFTLLSNNIEIIKNIQNPHNPFATIRFGTRQFNDVKVYSHGKPFYYRVLYITDVKCYRQITRGKYFIKDSVQFYCKPSPNISGGQIIEKLRDDYGFDVYQLTLDAAYLEKNKSFDPGNSGVIEF